jgi:hypothetical protein
VYFYAPQCISRRQVAYLLGLIEEYLYDRSETFSDKPLKPKHHYLCHYPSLILQFGPLLRLWTMRFESKHSYFKRCARVVKNFRNLSYSLARKHQLLQAYYSAGSLYCEDVTLDNCVQLNLSSMSSTLTDVILSRGLSFERSLCSESAMFRGTVYKAKQFLVLRAGSQNDQETCPFGTCPTLLGEIKLIIQTENGIVFFVVDKYISTYVSHLHLCTARRSDISLCVAYSELADYYPLHGYWLKQTLYIPLHHSVINVA